MPDDKRKFAKYRYTVEMTYLNQIKNKSTRIVDECVKYLIIDHNYDRNCMPVMYASLSIDKALMDDMILNVNQNLMLVAVFRYDDLTDTKEPIEVFRDKFTYFLPNDVNKTMDLDYQDQTIDEHQDNMFQTIVVGLMSVKLINLNKKMIELNVTNNNIYDCVKYFLADHENLVIETFISSEKLPRVIIPLQQSVNSALKFLNSYKVFYYTPYRFYQDFNYTYLISSSGKAIAKPSEQFNSVIFNIMDITDKDANDEGMVLNSDAKVYEIPVSYRNTDFLDNTVMNKSQNKILTYSSSGSKQTELQNKAKYAIKDKHMIRRLNNDNEEMYYNIQADADNHNVFISITKNDLDMDVLTINKKITVHNIDRYQEFNGDYLLSRKRELLMRDNKSCVLITTANLRKIGYIQS